MIIRNAKVQKIIGCESLTNGESYHTLTLVIEVERINLLDLSLKDGDIKLINI